MSLCSRRREPCFVGGFQEEDAIATATREFIEEALSGSIDLKHYAAQLYALCKVKQQNEHLSEAEKDYLKSFHINPEKFSGDIGEATYHFIVKEDPVFVTELSGYLKNALTVAYQGPCRADPRNTDDRWISSTVMTGLIDLSELTLLLERQKYPYRFVAGSDLVDVKRHEFGPSFLRDAFASHGALLCLATAHNLRKKDVISEVVLTQCEKATGTMKNILEGCASQTAHSLLQHVLI